MRNQRRAMLAATLCAAATAALASQAVAAALPGGIYVLRIGGTSDFGAGTTAANTTTLLPTFIDQFSLTGTTPGTTISMPTVFDAGTGNQAVTIPSMGAGNTNFAEGIMQISPDGKHLAVAGYPGAAGTAVADSASSKTFGIVDLTNGNVNSTLGFSSSIGPRSAVTLDGTDAYFAGSGNGIRYVTTNTPATAAPNTGTSVSVAFATNVNQRTASVYGGQLFLSGASSVGKTGDSGNQPGISALGTGLPMTTGTGVTQQKYIMSTAANPEQFVMLDQNPGVGWVSNIDAANAFDTKLDLTYVATDAGVERWSYNGTSWVQDYVLSGGLNTSARITAGMVGVTYAGKDANGHNILYGTTNGSQSGDDQGNALMKLVDDGSGSSWSLVALSPNNTWLRGLAFVPSAGIPGDVNHDGVVDLGDVNYVTARWLNTGSDGDADGNGVIDLGDINYITARWLNTSEPGGISAALAAVPEPASVGVLGVAAMALVRRRRR